MCKENDAGRHTTEKGGAGASVGWHLAECQNILLIYHCRGSTMDMKEQKLMEFQGCRWSYKDGTLFFQEKVRND